LRVRQLALVVGEQIVGQDELPDLLFDRHGPALIL
jgi:hypothetical protein